MIGLNVGSDSWINRYDAGYENNTTVRVNGQFRKKIIDGVQLRDFSLYMDIEKLDCDVVKDPQFLIHPEIIRHWVYVRKDISIIYLHREPKEIVESLKRVPDMNSPVFRNYPEMIKEKEELFLLVLKKRGIIYETINFPDFLNKFDEVYNTIYKFCNKKQKEVIKDREKCKRLWDMVVDKKKVHIQ